MLARGAEIASRGEKYNDNDGNGYPYCERAKFYQDLYTEASLDSSTDYALAIQRPDPTAHWDMWRGNPWWFRAILVGPRLLEFPGGGDFYKKWAEELQAAEEEEKARLRAARFGCTAVIKCGMRTK